MADPGIGTIVRVNDGDNTYHLGMVLVTNSSWTEELGTMYNVAQPDPGIVYISDLGMISSARGCVVGTDANECAPIV